MSLTVSVIICCYTEDRLDDIREAVASVQRQSRPPEEILLVVDNNRALYQTLSRTGLGSGVRIILHEGLRGSAAARNAGALATTSDVVAFIDDDAVADRRWLERVLNALANGATVAGGKAVPVWPGHRPSWFPEELDWLVGGTYRGYRNGRGVVRNVHIHNMALLRSAFLAVGMLETDAGGGGGMVATASRGGEEAELCLRLAHEFPSAKIVYEPGAKIWHKVGAQQASLRGLVRRSYGEGRYKAWVRSVLPIDSGRALSTEAAYLRYLVLWAIPSRLLRFWQPAALAQAAAIVACIAAVGTGYLVGKGQFRRISAARRT